jgi:hypothetical protein
MRILIMPWMGAVALALGVVGTASAQGNGGGHGALYSDLYVIERDGAGVPLTRDVKYKDPETGDTVVVACQQPLAETCAKLPLWGESRGFDPELYDPCSVYTPFVPQLQEVSFGRSSVARAPAHVLDKSYGEALELIGAAAGDRCPCESGSDPCDVDLVDPRAVKLDPAGRISLCLAGESDALTYEWKTIDSPLENLGLYRAAMKTGCLGTVRSEVTGEEGVRVIETTALDPTGIFYLGASGLGHLVCEYPPGTPLPTSAAEAAAAEAACTVTPDPVGGPPDPPCWWELALTPDGQTPGEGVDRQDMLSGAEFLAGATDKSSPLSIDEIVNLNNFLGVNVVQSTGIRGQQAPTIKYFPFKVKDGPGGWFAYWRGVDACVPGTMADLLQVTTEGFVAASIDVFGHSKHAVDLAPVRLPVCRNGSVLQVGRERVVCDDTWRNPVQTPNNPLGCGGANWFSQAAENARKTVWYLHNYELPEIAY